MIGTGNQNSSFFDETYGPNGFFIWILAPYLLFCIFIGTYCAYIATQPSSLDEMLACLLGIGVSSYMIFWVSCALLLANKTAKEVKINENKLFVKLYLGKKKTYQLNDFFFIRTNKNNWYFTQAKTFKFHGEHIELEFQPKEKIYISDNIEGYEELKALLYAEFSQKINLTKPDKNIKLHKASYADLTYGKRGRYIWFTVFLPVSFSIFLACAVISLQISNLSPTECCLIVLAMFPFLSLIITGVKSLKLAGKTAQELQLKDNTIQIRFYFGCTRMFLASEICNIKESKNDESFTEHSNAFKAQGNHLAIYLNSSQIIYISDSFQNYDELKNILLQLRESRNVE